MRRVATAPLFGSTQSAGARPSPLARRIFRRWPAIAAILVVTPIAVITAVGTVSWLGRGFPGFFVLENGVVPTVGLFRWTGIEHGVPFHARVIAVDGRPVTSIEEVYSPAARVPPGTRITYTLEKGDLTLTRAVPTMRFGATDYWLTLGLLEVFAILSVATGVVVYVLAPESLATLAFLVQGVLTGLFALTATALYHPRLSWLTPLHLIMQCAFPAAFVHLGLVFPVTREFVARRPAWLAVPYLIAGGLAASVCRGFYASPPTMSSLYVAYLFSALAIVVLLACAAYAYYENRHPQVRLQLRSVLPGLTVGTILGLYGFINTADQGGSFPINLIAATPFIFYLSIGYAIARHGLFDVDTLVRQSVVYGTLTLGITVLYTITVALLGRFQVVSGFVGARVLQVVFILVIAAAFAPLRERVQRLVDRTFYRTRVDYAATVRELSAALTSLLDLDDILGRVGRTLSDGLQLVSTTIVLWRERETRIWRYDPGRGRMQEMEAGSLEATRAELARNPQPWLVPDVGSAATVPLAIAAELATFDAALVVPLSLGGHVAGAFVLGRKRSGRPFTRDDIELLSTLAAQSAIAIENAHSYRDLKDLNEQLEHRVRARTADLERSNDELGGAYRELKAAQSQLVQSEKMASLGVLVAGVAHEINNPVSFIVNNMDPLREMVERLRAPTRAGVDPGINAVLNDMTEAIDVIALGAERTAGIVRDLRTFSRLSDQQAQPLDVHEGLEVTLRLLRPRLPDRVTVHRDYGELPPVDSAPGQLNQVFMNVLANACDAVEVAGNVWITTRCDGAVVTVAIRDDGSGIAAEDLGRIFDPFFTTKPQGKGTGLGLALSHGIIEAHGGRLEVQSEVGHGTTVTIIVPVRRPPPPAEG